MEATRVDVEKPWTVSQLSRRVKERVEGLGRVRVRGEVGRVVKARSGHMYFSLREEGETLDCVAWRGAAAKVGEQVQEGAEVVCEGRMTAYTARSQYQLTVDSARVWGEGVLLERLEELRRRLVLEGVFEEGKKRVLRKVPRVVGLVTSLGGAVVHDIVNRLRERVGVRLLIWDVRVQGEGCAQEIARALEGFGELEEGGEPPRPDVLVVARGGGSLEDLWGFNEERLVRAVAASVVPVISAVGHEVDRTLCDEAADVRAPTPTAAAQEIVPLKDEALRGLRGMGEEMGGMAVRRVVELGGLSGGLGLPGLEGALGFKERRADELGLDLSGAPRARLEAARLKMGSASLPASGERLGLKGTRVKSAYESMRAVLRSICALGEERAAGLSRELEALVVRGEVEREAALERGYALVRGPGGELASERLDEVSAGEDWEVEFAGLRVVRARTMGGVEKSGRSEEKGVG